MLQTIEAMLAPDGSIQLLESIEISKPTKVLLTLLNSKLDETTTYERGSAEGILDFMKNNPTLLKDRRTAKEISQYIERERNSWD